MEYTTIGKINEYVSKSVNPSNTPDTTFEVYSVPSFDTGHPEFLLGGEIASNKQLVQKDDILLCKINPRINRVWIVADETEHQSIASSEWIVIRSREYDPEFLAWYFRSPTFKRLMVSEVTGIGGSLTRAQPKCVAEYPVPTVDKDTQKKIVSTLNRVNGIILADKQQLAKLDELVNARFVEMFGTLFSTQYKIQTLGEACQFIKDGTHQTPIYSNDAQNGYKFLSSKDVTSKRICWNDVKYIPEELHSELYAKISPQKGDLLIAKNGTTGIAAVVDTDEIFDIYVSLALLRLKPNNNVYYIWAAVNSNEVKAQFDASLKGIGVPNLHLGEIKKTRIIVPPLPLQNQFAAFVAQVDKTKAAVQSALDKAQLLFDSLMQKYFG